jgi:hypothetical protein
MTQFFTKTSSIRGEESSALVLFSPFSINKNSKPSDTIDSALRGEYETTINHNQCGSHQGALGCSGKIEYDLGN